MQQGYTNRMSSNAVQEARGMVQLLQCFELYGQVSCYYAHPGVVQKARDRFYGTTAVLFPNAYPDKICATTSRIYVDSADFVSHNVMAPTVKPLPFFLLHVF